VLDVQDFSPLAAAPQYLYPQPPSTVTVSLPHSMEDSSAGEDPKTCPRGHWRPAEDEKLRQLVEQYGAQNWNSIAEKLQGRSGIYIYIYINIYLYDSCVYINLS